MLSKLLGRYRDDGYALAPVRLALGVIFLAHGSQKLFGLFGGRGLAATAQGFETMGFHPGMLWASLAAGSEFFGGLAVLIGLFSRLGALGITIVMLVAIFKVHLKNGFFLENHGFEYNVALIGLGLAVLIAGAGRLSVEQALARRAGEPRSLRNQRETASRALRSGRAP